MIKQIDNVKYTRINLNHLIYYEHKFLLSRTASVKARKDA